MRRIPSAGAGLLLLVLTGGCDQGKTVILIADAGNGRIVQMDDLSGTGWAVFTYPSVNKSVLSPSAVAADSQGRIYASSFGDAWISRMDDITGKGFVTLGRPGSGIARTKRERTRSRTCSGVSRLCPERTPMASREREW